MKKFIKQTRGDQTGIKYFARKRQNFIAKRLIRPMLKFELIEGMKRGNAALEDKKYLINPPADPGSVPAHSPGWWDSKQYSKSNYQYRLNSMSLLVSSSFHHWLNWRWFSCSGPVFSLIFFSWFHLKADYNIYSQVMHLKSHK